MPHELSPQQAPFALTNEGRTMTGACPVSAKGRWTRTALDAIPNLTDAIPNQAYALRGHRRKLEQLISEPCERQGHGGI